MDELVDVGQGGVVVGLAAVLVGGGLVKDGAGEDGAGSLEGDYLTA